MKSEKSRARAAVAYLVGFVFAIGLGLAGMTQPQKVIGFLDVMNWDPSLIFVMVGAIIVHSLAYVFIKNKKSPLLDAAWHVPKSKEITPRLIMGSALFGIGWGLGGLCLGPAIVSLGSGQQSIFAFVLAMLLGMWVFNKVEKALPFKK